MIQLSLYQMGQLVRTRTYPTMPTGYSAIGYELPLGDGRILTKGIGDTVYLDSRYSSELIGHGDIADVEVIPVHNGWDIYGLDKPVHIDRVN